MRKAAGVRKPNESKRSEGRLEDEGGKRRGSGFFMTQSARTTFWEEKKRLELSEEHLKDPIVALDKALKCLEKPYC